MLADCSNLERLPKLGFDIGGRVLNLEPRTSLRKLDLIYRTVDCVAHAIMSSPFMVFVRSVLVQRNRLHYTILHRMICGDQGLRGRDGREVRGLADVHRRAAAQGPALRPGHPLPPAVRRGLRREEEGVRPSMSPGSPQAWPPPEPGLPVYYSYCYCHYHYHYHYYYYYYYYYLPLPASSAVSSPPAPGGEASTGRREERIADR